MKNKSFLILLTFVSLFQIVNSQTIENLNTTEKAVYIGGDIKEILSPKIKYPMDALRSDVQGDVVISFIVLKNGELDSLTIVKSPDKSLSTNSLMTFILLENNWKPAQIKGVAIDKKQLVVFRYRMYLNSQPKDIKGMANKSFIKQKYQKALQQYNTGIKDNEYDNELYSSRAKVKEILGDIEGAKKDKLISIKLNDEIISIIDVLTIGITRTIRTTSTTSTIIRNY